MSGPILQALAKQRDQQSLLRRAKRSVTNDDDEFISKTPLHERPFDPSLAPQQLAHAKQRIRDLEAACTAATSEMTMLKNSMIAKDDILRYVRESVLHDCLLWSSNSSEPVAATGAAGSTTTDRRAEYQRTLKSMLDVELLHSMSFEADKTLLLDQLVQLEEKVRLMTSKDAARVKAIRERDCRIEELELTNEELRGVISSLKASLSNSELALAQATDEISGMKEQRRVQTQMNKSLEEDIRRQASEINKREAAVRETTDRMKALQEQLDSMTSASSQNGDQQLSVSAVTQGKQFCLDAARAAEQLVKADSFDTTGKVLQAVQEANDRLRGIASEAGLQVVADMMKHGSRCTQLLLQNLKLALKREEDSSAAVLARENILNEQVMSLEKPLAGIAASAAAASGLDKNQRVASTAATVKQVSALLDGVSAARENCLTILAEDSLQRFATAEKDLFKGLASALSAIANQIEYEAVNNGNRSFKSGEPSPTKLPGNYSAAAAEGISKCVEDLSGLYAKSAAQLFPSSLDAKLQLRRDATSSIAQGEEFSDSAKATLAEYQLGQFDSMVTVDVVNALLQVVDRDHIAMNAARKDISNLHAALQQLQHKVSESMSEQAAASELARRNSLLRKSDEQTAESQQALVEQLCKDVLLIATAQQDALSCSSKLTPVALVSNETCMNPDGYLCARGIVHDVVDRSSAVVDSIADQLAQGDSHHPPLVKTLAQAVTLLFDTLKLERKESATLWQCFSQLAPAEMLTLLNSSVPPAVPPTGAEKKAKAAEAGYQKHLTSCRLQAIDSVREQQQLTAFAEILKPPPPPPAATSSALASQPKAPKARSSRSIDRGAADESLTSVCVESKTVQTDGTFISEEAAKKATMAAVNSAVQQIKPQMSKKKAPPTVEEAEEVLKAAGKWPRRESSIAKRDEPASQRPNWCQTDDVKKPRTEDKEVETDAELLDSFLGIAPSSPAGGAGRKRSVSYVQVFGEGGVLERLASGVEAEQGGALNALFRKFSAPSIPDCRHGSMDAPAGLVVGVTGVAAIPQRATSKYSLTSLLSKRELLSSFGSKSPDATRKGGDTSIANVGVDAQSEPGSEEDIPDDTAAAAAVSGEDPFATAGDRRASAALINRRPSTAPDQRRGSTNKKSMPMHTSNPSLPFSVASDRTAPGGPSDFYSLLLHHNKSTTSGGGAAVRPGSAASSRQGGSPHSDIDSPSSLHESSKKNLRQRAAEVEKLHSFIHNKVDPAFGVPKNPVEMRIARIQSVIGGSGASGKPPAVPGGDGRAPQRRQSVRQLVQQACGPSSTLRSSLAVVCPDKQQQQISAWDSTEAEPPQQQGHDDHSQ